MPHQVYLWRKAPALRLLAPFITGICAQWYMQFSLIHLLATAISAAAIIILFSFLPLARQYWLKAATGICINLLVAASGAIAIYTSDIRNNRQWIGNHYQPNQKLLVTIEETPVEKQASYKAAASIKGILKNDTLLPATGRVILYFKKEDAQGIEYGSQIVLQKPLQEIKNSGNPGSFDYKRYSLFQGITHHAYITAADYALMPQTDKRVFKMFAQQSQQSIVHILQQYIKGSKEQGLAEALLIGYKDDLDKTLVQSYTNTGVVHIIAISGLHLGLIYLLLAFATKPLKRKHLHWLRLIIIVAGLWTFSLVAGAQPSILRAAVMFSAIAVAEILDRRTSIINTLALSAFLLLVYNPFWLWDVGFQLSYLAVLSIIIFYQPIYGLLYFPNKSIDFIWKLAAVSLAAQILTTPISLYYFHQFPLLFLLTNIVAVPWSSLILFAELALCILSFIPPIAKFIGFVLHYLIKWMNLYIERLNDVSFAVWDGLYINILQTLLLFAFITAAAYFLLDKKRSAATLSVVFLLLFIAVRTTDFLQAYHQKKLIVYNIPKMQAIDVIDGRQYYFIGDAALANNTTQQNFYVQPSRVMHRVQPANNHFQKAFTFYGKTILIIDHNISLPQKGFQNVDVLVLSKNPKLYIANLLKAFTIKQLVIDASVPQWKVKLWQQECNTHNIPCYNVRNNGAFVMNIQ